MKEGLTGADLMHAADALDCEVAAIEAVCDVEAPNGGFNINDTPVTLFEAHKFHKYTNGLYDADYPNLSSEHWDRTLYGNTWRKERNRLGRALKLDREAALKSTSWGKFQIMGFNYELAGYSELEEFVTDMHRSERDQLMAFVSFIKNSELDVALRDHKWAEFARGYNGSGYAENHYDERLAEAFAKHSQESHDGYFNSTRSTR